MASPTRTRYSSLIKDYAGLKAKAHGIKLAPECRHPIGKLAPTYKELKKYNTSAKPRCSK